MHVLVASLFAKQPKKLEPQKIKKSRKISKGHGIQACYPVFLPKDCYEIAKNSKLKFFCSALLYIDL